MTTYFIRTALPLDDAHRAVFAQHHAESTHGNQLSVMQNGAGTECLIKVNCDHVIADILPEGFTPLEVIEGVDLARELIQSEAWTAQAPV